MLEIIASFIKQAIIQGIPLLYGSTGEILTEKSGNLNLGIPGIMYIGGISGVIGAYFYEKSVVDINPFLCVMIPLLCSILGSVLMALIYCFLTVTLRANQNVTGLALTTFGMGFGNFFGGSLSRLAGGVGQISTQATASAFRAKIPVLSTLPVVGEVLFSYGFLTYFSIVLTVVLSWFLYRTRKGLNLRAVGENAATADAAGVNVTAYKYLACLLYTSIDTSFAEYGETWLDTYRTKCNPMQHRQYQSFIDYASEHFGKKMLRSITATDVQRLYNTLAGYSQSHINKFASTIRSIFRAALQDVYKRQALPWSEEQQKTHSGKSEPYSAGIWHQAILHSLLPACPDTCLQQ